MSPDVKTSFLTYYIQSLAERTRAEKSGTKFGFDWIIYNLALADNLTPFRLPFLRAGADEISKTKTEHEYGVDLAFLSPDGSVLTIFVLKDESLTSSHWAANDFNTDIRNAASPDLRSPELSQIKRVKIVLAYNKDEDSAGTTLYERLTLSLGTSIYGGVELSFERWNLTVLTEKVQSKLLTPSLLPQKFFSLFSYVCSQFGDFRHGSDEWINQLLPNWNRFLRDLLEENADERAVRMIPVALIILRDYGANNPSAETGFIDLTEMGMLAVWQVCLSRNGELKEGVRRAILQVWMEFYLTQVESYYQRYSKDLAVENSITVLGGTGYVDAIAAAMVAFWHIGRLGILSLAYSEVFSGNDEKHQRSRFEALSRVANTIILFLNANPSTARPLIDLHHIEIFLIWASLWQVGKKDDLYTWLQGLRAHLLVRRAGTVAIPFIEGGNSLDLVFEHVATGSKPPEFNDQSSFLTLMVLELCFSLDPPKRDELLEAWYREIVLGRDSLGQQMEKCKPLDLMGWSPPKQWTDTILTKSLSDEGESQSLELFEGNQNGEFIAERIQKFVHQSRSSRAIDFPTGIPLSVIVLACLKLRSPLPAELWRQPIFGPSTVKREEEKGDST